MDDFFNPLNQPFKKLEKDVSVFDRCLDQSPYDKHKVPLPEELNQEPLPTHPYVKKIPEGYQYCGQCELLTPHTLNSQINPSKAIPSDYECDLCGSKKYGYDNCPNCGWEHDPERDLMPVTIKVKKHTTACIQKQSDKKFHFQEEIEYRHMKDDCDCPEVDAYPIQPIFNYRERSVFSMDCSNAREWDYDVMCPICNEVFEVSDGNC